MVNILITDDDIEFTELLSEYLTSQGLNVTIANDGEQGLKEANSQQYDVMILDIMMPKIDGLEVLRRLNEPKIPTIMLSAKDDDVDIVIGLELGADDYLTKPTNPRELLARINALLRRTKGSNQTTTVNSDIISGNSGNNSNKNSDIFIDTQTRVCQIKGESLKLTGTEFDLLYMLIKKTGQPVSKEELSLQVFERELQPFDRSIDVHISRLRKKLETHHKNPITTIRGKGYQLSFS